MVVDLNYLLFPSRDFDFKRFFFFFCQALRDHLYSAAHDDTEDSFEAQFKSVFKKLCFTANEKLDSLAVSTGLKLYLAVWCPSCESLYGGTQEEHESMDFHRKLAAFATFDCPSCNVTMTSRIEFHRHLLTKEHIAVS
jgi:hypothetical protein